KGSGDLRSTRTPCAQLYRQRERRPRDESLSRLVCSPRPDVRAGARIAPVACRYGECTRSTATDLPDPWHVAQDSTPLSVVFTSACALVAGAVWQLTQAAVSGAVSITGSRIRSSLGHSLP